MTWPRTGCLEGKLEGLGVGGLLLGAIVHQRRARRLTPNTDSTQRELYHYPTTEIDIGEWIPSPIIPAITEPFQDELQDIDMLRGKLEDAEAFLRDFKEEKAAGRYEAGNTMEALSPTSTSARRRSFFGR